MALVLSGSALALLAVAPFGWRLGWWAVSRHDNHIFGHPLAASSAARNRSRSRTRPNISLETQHPAQRRSILCATPTGFNLRQQQWVRGEKMSATNMIKSLQVKDAEPRGMRDSVGPAGGVELVEDLTDVEFGGMDRNVEPPGDLLVGGALGKQC